jgi:hypothetical protein
VALLTRSIRIVSAGDNLGHDFPAESTGYYFGGHTLIRQGVAGKLLFVEGANLIVWQFAASRCPTVCGERFRLLEMAGEGCGLTARGVLRLRLYAVEFVYYGPESEPAATAGPTPQRFLLVLPFTSASKSVAGAQCYSPFPPHRDSKTPIAGACLKLRNPFQTPVDLVRGRLACLGRNKISSK